MTSLLHICVCSGGFLNGVSFKYMYVSGFLQIDVFCEILWPRQPLIKSLDAPYLFGLPPTIPHFAVCSIGFRSSCLQVLLIVRSRGYFPGLVQNDYIHSIPSNVVWIWVSEITPRSKPFRPTSVPPCKTHPPPRFLLSFTTASPAVSFSFRRTIVSL